MCRHFLFIFFALFFVQCDSADTDDETEKETIRLLKTYEMSGDSNYKIQLFYNEDQTLDYALSTSEEFDNFIRKYIYEDGLLIRSEIRDENNVLGNSYEEYTYKYGKIYERRDLYNDEILDETYRFFILNDRIDRVEYYAQENPELRNEYIYIYDSMGNVIQQNDINYTGKDYEYQYTYDDKSNPFQYINPFFILWEDFPSRINNPIKVVRINTSDNVQEKTTNYTYLYNEEGYPTMQSDGTDTVIFTYY